MHNFIRVAISSFCLVFSSMYVWKKLSDKEINYFSIKGIITYIICSLLITINYLFGLDFIKPVISTLVMIFTFYFLYKDNIIKTIILPIYSQILVIISEFLYVALVIIIHNVNEVIIKEQYFGSIITNLFVALFCILITKLKITKNIYNKLLTITEGIKKYQLIFFSFILIIIANILTTFLYYKVSLLALMIINTTIIVIYMIFVFIYFKTNNKFVKVSDKYNMTLNSLKEYEDILSKYRISNHENKNQLLTIRGMVKNKKVISYIDEIIENKIKDNEKLMIDSLVIPEGGLRGLIYSKMLLMQENNIEFDLCVDKKIKTSDLTSISDDLMLNICNIVGVYLDNAIEAVKDLEEKYIIIELYMNNTLNIAISNNYGDDIDVDKIENIGYSTKGGNHGYGLSLVKEILNNNKNIKSIKRISEDEFTQEISINIKKKM